jgi:hypothetical protein
MNGTNSINQTTPEQPLQFQEMTSLVIFSTSTTHNQMILTPVAMSKPFPPPIHPCKQFKPNTRPDANAKAMYERATTLSAPIGIFIEADVLGRKLL